MRINTEEMVERKESDGCEACGTSDDRFLVVGLALTGEPEGDYAAEFEVECSVCDEIGELEGKFPGCVRCKGTGRNVLGNLGGEHLFEACALCRESFLNGPPDGSGGPGGDEELGPFDRTLRTFAARLEGFSLAMTATVEAWKKAGLVESSLGKEGLYYVEEEPELGPEELPFAPEPAAPLSIVTEDELFGDPDLVTVETPLGEEIDGGSDPY